MANPYFNYDYATWFASASQLIGKQARITKPVAGGFTGGWINDVISPDQGAHFNRILLMPYEDTSGLLIELGTGEYQVK